MPSIIIPMAFASLLKGRLPLVADRPIHPVTGLPMEAYQARQPAPSFPATPGVVARMTTPPGPPRMIPGDPALVRPRFEEIPRHAAGPVGQPNVRFATPEGEIRPGWMAGEREWPHAPRADGNWIPPRSDPGAVPVPHAVRHERPPFIGGANQFY